MFEFIRVRFVWNGDEFGQHQNAKLVSFHFECKMVH
jgi:hypothetical protein